MKQINNPEEFKKFYPYNPSLPKKSEYPTTYPCFCEIMTDGGGLMGEYMYVKIIYPPKDVDLKSFELGLKAGKGLIWRLEMDL